MFEQVFNVLKGSQNKEAGYTWINYILRPDVQAKWVSNYLWSPVNKTVEVPDELKPLVPISGEEFLMLQKRLEEEYFADWNPGQELSNPEFVDRSLEAAITVLKGETYYPRVLTK